MKPTRFAQESAAQAQGMNATLRYEIKARAFHAMTGYMAPGKDAPSGLPDDYAAREAAWVVWDKSHQKIIDAMLNAVSAELFTEALDVLLEACKTAEVAFDLYAMSHRQKGTPDGDRKAKENERLANVCRAAITKATDT